MAEPPADRPLFIVFGATGDLMRRKLLPALFGLNMEGFHPAGACVLGVARNRELTDQSFRQIALDALGAQSSRKSKKVKDWCRTHLFYQSVGEGKAEDYRRLATRIEKLERSQGLSGNRVLYLALPLFAIQATIEGIQVAGLQQPGKGWTRVVLEKPFGHDLSSARALNDHLHQIFDERQIFRIDHYLGKETVQNLLVFRFSNMLFESIWNRDRVERVEITVAESLGLEGRAQYYEESGALRDMMQNHLTQLLTLIAMEVPVAYEAEPIRNEKVKVLRAIHPARPRDVVRGQYTKGTVDGKSVPGYRQEEGVRPDSRTETFVALKLEVENWRWHGVPFFLRTGKRLGRRVTQILVRFRRPPVAFFQPFVACELASNELLITVQPDEGFDLVFEVKSPGPAVTLRTERMHFRYAEAFASLPDDYQTLLLDVIEGDPTLFVRADEVEESWRIYDLLLKNPPPIQTYSAGSWGPPEALSWMSPPESPLAVP